MTTPTILVNTSLDVIDGSAAEGWKIRFQLSNTVAVSGASGTIVAGDFEDVIVDADGDQQISLFRNKSVDDGNYYTVSLLKPNTKRWINAGFVEFEDVAGPVNLQDVIVTQDPGTLTAAQAAVITANDAADRAEAAADRVDLGALDQAVTDAEAAKGASETASALASSSAASSSTDATRAEDAADAAEDAVQYEYFVNDAAALSALAGMTTGERAYQRDNEHIYEYNGSTWDDLGASPTAEKLSIRQATTGDDIAAIEDALRGSYEAGTIAIDDVTGKEVLGADQDGRIRASEGLGLYKASTDDDDILHMVKLVQDDGRYPLIVGANTITGEVELGKLSDASKARNGIVTNSSAADIQFGAIASTTNLYIYFEYGQSLSIGTVANISNMPDYAPAKALIQHPLSPRMSMLSVGMSWPGSSALPTIIDLFPAREQRKSNNGQSHGSGFMMKMEELRRRENDAIDCQTFFGHGWGGKAIADLGSASVPFTNGTTALSRIVELAASYGLTPVYLGTGFTHGVSDRNSTTVADYKTALIDIVEARNTAAQAEIARAEPYKFFAFQLSAGSNNGSAIGVGSSAAPGNPAEAISELVDERSDIVVIGPRYHYPVIDSVHSDATGYDLMGETEAYVVHQVEIEGNTWKPLRITNVARSGTTITVTVETPPSESGSVYAERKWITAATNDGFEYDGANITSVSIGTTTANSCDITITIDADTGGTLYYAWTGAGVTRDTDTGLYPHAAAWGNIALESPEQSITHGNKAIIHYMLAHKEAVA